MAVETRLSTSPERICFDDSGESTKAPLRVGRPTAQTAAVIRDHERLRPAESTQRITYLVPPLLLIHIACRAHNALEGYGNAGSNTLSFAVVPNWYPKNLEISLATDHGSLWRAHPAGDSPNISARPH